MTPRNPASDALAAQFTSVYRQYVAVVRGRANRIVMNPDAAEDVTQEVFIKLANYMRKRTPIQSVGALLYHMTTQLAVRKLKQVRKHASSADTCDMTSRHQPPDDQLLFKELITRAGVDEARIACAYYIDGMTRDEIATALGMSRRSVGRELDHFCHRARRMIRDRIAPEAHVQEDNHVSIRAYKSAPTR